MRNIISLLFVIIQFLCGLSYSINIQADEIQLMKKYYINQNSLEKFFETEMTDLNLLESIQIIWSLDLDPEIRHVEMLKFKILIVKHGFSIVESKPEIVESGSDECPFTRVLKITLKKNRIDF